MVIFSPFLTAGFFVLLTASKIQSNIPKSKWVQSTSNRNFEITHSLQEQKSDLSGNLGKTDWRPASASAIKQSRNADILFQRAVQVAKKNGIPLKELRGLRFGSTSSCHQEPKCVGNYRTIRTIDGSCNNIENPSWGKAHTPQLRLLDPDYADGIMLPRKDRRNQNLPSARLISFKLFNNDERVLHRYTSMLTQWGQFIDHDISLTPKSPGLSCCGRGASKHPQCFPIEIPANDPFYSSFGENCMEFSRSLPALPRRCTLGHREQMNQITAYIDGSMIYGSDEITANSLRAFTQGRLKIYDLGGMNLLPLNPKAPQCAANLLPCFNAGDIRVNETPDLVSFHTVFVREHNRIVEALSEINPTWKDEKLYQEGRKIVIAELQHVTYNEFLPLVIGETYAKTRGLLPKSKFSYNKSIESTISTEFSTSAFRFGHSMVQGVLELFNKVYIPLRNISLSSVAFAPGFLYENGAVDEVLRGLLSQKCRNVDLSFTNQIHTMLFARNASFGQDLPALNIQRGRDHGIAGYKYYVEWCSKTRINYFSNLTLVMELSKIAALKKMYKNVRDIDLYVGGLMESRKNGLIGPTFKCILTDQFKRLKFGDRFFYENSEPRVGFTPEQLEAIRKVTLSRILCDNTDDIGYIQRNSFERVSRKNTWKACSSEGIGTPLDFSLWKIKQRV